MIEENLNWYAIYTKPRWEKKIAKLLDEKGIENYCPLNRVIRQWSDRKKVILEPVFKSYVFVKIKDADKWELKKINGILNFVYWLGKPAVIKEDEIFTIRKFLNEFDDVQVEDRGDFRINEMVKVKQGILMNYQGMILEINGKNVKVRIESMGIYLHAQFDKKNLQPLSI